MVHVQEPSWPHPKLLGDLARVKRAIVANDRSGPLPLQYEPVGGRPVARRGEGFDILVRQAEAAAALRQSRAQTQARVGAGSGLQDVAHLGFRAATMPCGAQLKGAMCRLGEVPDCHGGHDGNSSKRDSVDGQIQFMPSQPGGWFPANGRRAASICCSGYFQRSPTQAESISRCSATRV